MRWEDLPQVKMPKTDIHWQEEAVELRAHPGKWAIIRQYLRSQKQKAYAFQGAIRSGRVASFTPAPDFESATRTDGDIIKVYVRYVGPE